MANQMMNSNGGGSAKDRMQLLTTVTFTPINSSSKATSSSQSYDLSSYDVSGKTADDFFIRITAFSTSAAVTQSRSFKSLVISSFSDSKLTLTGTYDYYDYHAINFGVTVEIYMFT